MEQLRPGDFLRTGERRFMGPIRPILFLSSPVSRVRMPQSDLSHAGKGGMTE